MNKFTKEEVFKYLKDDNNIHAGFIYAMMLSNGNIYINCHSDCNCCPDEITFDDFYDMYGSMIKSLD